MKFVIQRVNHAKCTINGKITGSIEKGLCVLIGVAETDTKEIADICMKTIFLPTIDAMNKEGREEQYLL